MLSYEFYKVFHVVGIVLVMSALGATSVYAINGGTRRTNRVRGLVAGLHGLGLLLLLVAGFGMAARKNLMGPQMLRGWLITKVVIWIVLAAALVLPYRRPTLARPLYLLLPVLGGVAAWMAIYKPF